MRQRRKKRELGLLQPRVRPVQVYEVESLDIEGRGIAHHEGKVAFVEGALPFEQVRAELMNSKGNYDVVRTLEVLRAAPARVVPECPSFGVCGGCAMQHLHPRAQLAVKQRVLEDNLQRIGRVRPEAILRPIMGPTWGYRYRARMSARWVEKKGTVLVGFHEKHTRFLVDMTHCAILPPHVSRLLPVLRDLVSHLSIRERMPQVEVAVGQAHTAFVFRNMDALTPADEALMRAFADEHAIDVWLQPKGPETVYPFYPEQERLYYDMPEFGVRMPYRPTDFTQVNFEINRVLVGRAVRLLDVLPHERVADFFCGLGNFTLPLATRAEFVVGVEGSTQLNERAMQNAVLNGLADKTEFFCQNLFDATADGLRALGHLDKYLVDPPREGADALCQALVQLRVEERPTRIVYVSCNPSTLARDASTLVHQAGFRLVSAGVVNMFPHTAHVESIAVFERVDEANSIDVRL